MKLSEIPFYDIKLGQKVIGANKIAGTITAKFSALQLGEIDDFADKHELEITWASGQISSKIWHMWCDKIDVVADDMLGTIEETA